MPETPSPSCSPEKLSLLLPVPPSPAPGEDAHQTVAPANEHEASKQPGNAPSMKQLGLDPNASSFTPPSDSLKASVTGAKGKGANGKGASDKKGKGDRSGKKGARREGKGSGKDPLKVPCIMEGRHLMCGTDSRPCGRGRARCQDGGVEAEERREGGTEEGIA